MITKEFISVLDLTFKGRGQWRLIIHQLSSSLDHDFSISCTQVQVLMIILTHYTLRHWCLSFQEHRYVQVRSCCKTSPLAFIKKKTGSISLTLFLYWELHLRIIYTYIIKEVSWEAIASSIDSTLMYRRVDAPCFTISKIRTFHWKSLLRYFSILE